MSAPDKEEPAVTTPLRRQYLDIKRRYPQAIVFFRLGDFYETFDEDAQTVDAGDFCGRASAELAPGELGCLRAPAEAGDGERERLRPEGLLLAGEATLPDGSTAALTRLPDFSADLAVEALLSHFGALSL